MRKIAQKCSKGNTGLLSKKRLQSFTSYREEAPEFDEKKMTYMGYEKEICPTTGRHHWQGFVYWKNQHTVKAGAKLLKNAHVENSIGSLEDNEKYCNKEGNMVTFGTRPKQGKRTDLEDLTRDIFEGRLNAEDVIEENPIMYHQYGRTLEKAEDMRMRKLFRTEMTEGIWIVGESGSGKSHMAFENYSADTHYLFRSDNGWWEGYKQQEIVIINDFRGEIKYGELLQIIDKWPYFVKRRGREPMPFISKKVIITSTQTPWEVYNKLSESDNMNQLLRRIKLINSQGQYLIGEKNEEVREFRKFF